MLTDKDGQDTIAIRSIQRFTLGFDHRIVDGADAGKFMTDFKNYLENWSEDLGCSCIARQAADRKQVRRVLTPVAPCSRTSCDYRDLAELVCRTHDHRRCRTAPTWRTASDGHRTTRADIQA